MPPASVQHAAGRAGSVRRTLAERDDRRYNMPVENYEGISFVCATPACTKVNAEDETVRCTSIRFTSFWQKVKLSEDGADDDDVAEVERLDMREREQSRAEQRAYTS